MNEELKALLASWGRSFLAACLAQFIAIGGSAFDISLDGWKSIAAAGLAAIVPVIIRWLNPKDYAFGIKGDGDNFDR
jgi:hypothetical protein